MKQSSSEVLPDIALIIATSNVESTLVRCLESFAQQTYQKKSLILIDGGSTDGTVEIIKHYQHLISYWISEPDKGIYNAWNKGLKHINGGWVGFIGADDYLTAPDVLERMAAKLIDMPSHVRLVYADILLVNQHDEALFKVGKPWHVAKQEFTQLMSIPHPGAMHRAQLFIDHGGFDETYRIAGDYEFLLRELKHADAAYCEDLTIITMRHGGISSNPVNGIKQLKEVRSAQLKHGIKIPGIRWISALLKAWIRVYLWRLLGENVARNLMDLGRRVLGKPSFWTRTK